MKNLLVVLALAALVGCSNKESIALQKDIEEQKVQIKNLSQNREAIDNLIGQCKFSMRAFYKPKTFIQPVENIEYSFFDSAVEKLRKQFARNQGIIEEIQKESAELIEENKACANALYVYQIGQKMNAALSELNRAIVINDSRKN
jgi:uncharacterized protein YcfL